MTRIRSLEGREAGWAARIIQWLARRTFGCDLNPIKVQAHFPSAMVASFVSNALVQSGKSAVGKDLGELMRVRVAALNGCPF